MATGGRACAAFPVCFCRTYGAAGGIRRGVGEAGTVRGCERAVRELSAVVRLSGTDGDSLLQQRRFREAVIPLRQLTVLRRMSEDWLILGLSEFQSGDQEAGLESVRKAAAIQPFRRDISETLKKLTAAAGVP
ncbi:MAG: tetratricopeptide repeat protein [Planctomyces sp.]